MQSVLTAENEIFFKIREVVYESMPGPKPFHRFTISTTDCLSPPNASK